MSCLFFKKDFLQKKQVPVFLIVAAAFATEKDGPEVAVGTGVEAETGLTDGGGCWISLCWAVAAAAAATASASSKLEAAFRGEGSIRGTSSGCGGGDTASSSSFIALPEI